MIKHVVCYKLKDNSRENCEKVKEVLMSMEGRVPEAKKIRVNIDELRSKRSYDIILEVMIDNFEDMVSYQENTYHVEVVKEYMKKVVLSSVALDYTVD